MSAKDQVSYRAFTDRPEEEAIEGKNDDNNMVTDEEAFGKGFRAFLPSKTKEESSSSDSGPSSQEGYFTFKG